MQAFQIHPPKGHAYLANYYVTQACQANVTKLWPPRPCLKIDISPNPGVLWACLFRLACSYPEVYYNKTLLCFTCILVSYNSQRWQQLRTNASWGAWMARSVERPTSAQVMISPFVRFSPVSGLAPGACFRFCVSHPYTPPPVTTPLSLCLKINKRLKKLKKKKEPMLPSFLSTSLLLVTERVNIINWALLF